MALQQPQSPLDQISNLEIIAPEKVKALEERLAKRFPKLRQRTIEDFARAQEMRKVVLF